METVEAGDCPSFLKFWATSSLCELELEAQELLVISFPQRS